MHWFNLNLTKHIFTIRFSGAVASSYSKERDPKMMTLKRVIRKIGWKQEALSYIQIYREALGLREPRALQCG